MPWQGNPEVGNMAFLTESFWQVQTGQNRPKDFFLWVLSWFCVMCAACSNTWDNFVARVYSKVRRAPQQVSFFWFWIDDLIKYKLMWFTVNRGGTDPRKIKSIRQPLAWRSERVNTKEKEGFKLKNSTARRSTIITKEFELGMRTMWLNTSQDFWKTLLLWSRRYKHPH